MNQLRACLFLLGLCVTTSWGESAVQQPGKPGKEGAKGAKKANPKFTIGKETTYITGPLRKDGCIDYPAALNKYLSRGVTRENNASILFWKAIGPHPVRATLSPAFFKLLGYQPPELGDYFTDLDRHLRKHYKGDPDKLESDIERLQDRVTERPWTAKQFPQVAAWLKANEKALALVTEGTKRSRYFTPLLPKDDEGLIGARIPWVQPERELASALSIRAMLHIGEGRYAEGWQDLLTCHRLG